MIKKMLALRQARKSLSGDGNICFKVSAGCGEERSMTLSAGAFNFEVTGISVLYHAFNYSCIIIQVNNKFSSMSTDDFDQSSGSDGKTFSIYIWCEACHC